MPRYFPGLNEALADVKNMDLDCLLGHIDRLYGRDNLQYGASVEDVREEALAQTRRDFLVERT